MSEIKDIKIVCTAVITRQMPCEPVKYRLVEYPRTDWWGKFWGLTEDWVESDFGRMKAGRGTGTALLRQLQGWQVPPGSA
jgi:hypothetical protein